MSKSKDKAFEQSWEAILEFGLNRFQSEEIDINISYQDKHPSDYEAASAAVSDICKLISDDTRDNLSLVNKTYARIQAQVELVLEKRVLQSVRAGKRQGLLLESLSAEWEKYSRFKDWLDGIFSGLNKIIRENDMFEDNDIFETERLAADCFGNIVYSPFSKRFCKKVVKKFKNHITCMTPRLIDADMTLFGSIRKMLKGISTPQKNHWADFRHRFILPRCQEYHRMASSWIKSMSFEDFASCILRHSEREMVAGEACFDEKLGKRLHHASICVFAGKYLPKMFRKNKELYKTWVREENLTPLNRINKVIVWNTDVAEEATEIFRVSFIKKICSALNMDCRVFLANDKGAFKSPFHAYCPTGRKEGWVLRQEVFCMDEIMEAMLEAFGGHATLLKAFSASRHLFHWCEKILEVHVTPCQKCVLPEALLSFCKSVLSKHGCTDVSPKINSSYAKVLIFMRFVSKPGPFHEIYTEDLYKRIVEDRLTSDAAERIMLSALSVTVEETLIKKGMRMLRDHCQSRKLFDLFTSSPSGAAFHQQNKTKMILRVNLFLNGTLTRRKPFPISVPVEIQVCHQSYEDFFRTRHERSELEWNYMLGSVTVETHLFSKGKAAKTRLELSVEQYSILNLFQERDEVSLREVIERLVVARSGSSERARTLGILKRVILSMMTSQCPLLEKNSDKISLAETDILTLNTLFKSGTGEIKVPDPDYTDTTEVITVRESHSDPMYLIGIESAISVIMKDLRRASRDRLISLVSEKVGRLYELTEEAFDTCIAKLIEREYIAREDGLDSCFTYVL